MQLDIILAKYLLNRKIPINTVKYILSIAYLITSLMLYFIVFAKKPSFGSGIIFLLVFVFFGYLRTKNLENFFRNRNKL
jgi:DMSO/TMAO reductase YedYZ heme-binding membrane subunit